MVVSDTADTLRGSFVDSQYHAPRWGGDRSTTWKDQQRNRDRQDDKAVELVLEQADLFAETEVVNDRA